MEVHLALATTFIDFVLGVQLNSQTYASRHFPSVDDIEDWTNGLDKNQVTDGDVKFSNMASGKTTGEDGDVRFINNMALGKTGQDLTGEDEDFSFSNMALGKTREDGDVSFRNMKTSLDSTDVPFHQSVKIQQVGGNEPLQRSNQSIEVYDSSAYTNYLANTVSKYLKTISELQKRIKSTLNRFKHHPHSNECRRLPKVLYSLKQLQNSLNYFAAENDFNERTTNSVKMSSQLERQENSTPSPSRKFPVTIDPKVRSHGSIRNAWHISKVICKGLEVESKEVINFLRELQKLLFPPEFNLPKFLLKTSTKNNSPIKSDKKRRPEAKRPGQRAKDVHYDQTTLEKKKNPNTTLLNPLEQNIADEIMPGLSSLSSEEQIGDTKLKRNISSAKPNRFPTTTIPPTTAVRGHQAATTSVRGHQAAATAARGHQDATLSEVYQRAEPTPHTDHMEPMFNSNEDYEGIKNDSSDNETSLLLQANKEQKGSNLTLHDEVMIGRHTTLGEGSDVPGGSTKSSPDRVMLGGLKVIAGSASSSHCSRCERRVNETVCGANGQTFPTLCHAINCGGLSLNDITYGNCRNKNVCIDSMCKSDEVCVPLSHSTCLAIYTKHGTERLPCPMYTCSKCWREEQVHARVDKCHQNKVSSVCGTNGKTYSSLCSLYRSRMALGYTGPCRPSQCQGPVCGIDMNTYPSSCHAQARGIKIDHKGKCFLASGKSVSSCVQIRARHLCSRIQCREVVLPVDQCCPICGGAVTAAWDKTKLYEFLSASPTNNHLFVLEKILREKLTSKTIKKCHLYIYLTTTGNLSILMEALNAGDHIICSKALTNLQTRLSKAPSQNHLKVAYDMLQPGTWLAMEPMSFQHTILEPVGYVENERPGGIDRSFLDVDRYLMADSSHHRIWRSSVALSVFHSILMWL